MNQIKVCTQELVEWARTRGAGLLLVAHVTKEGAIAGPKLVEHLVDTVLSFEQASAEVRTLQAMKNRFGSVDEIGFFRMTETGLAEVADASSLFLTRRDGEIPAGRGGRPGLRRIARPARRDPGAHRAGKERHQPDLLGPDRHRPRGADGGGAGEAPRACTWPSTTST